MVLMGDVREDMARGCMNYVEDFVNGMKHIQEPFYVVYHANTDRFNPKRINQTVKAYHQKPPAILGILVWYIDNPKGIFEFRADLSAPHDVPLNPKTLSENPKDLVGNLVNRAKQLPILLS